MQSHAKAKNGTVLDIEVVLLFAALTSFAFIYLWYCFPRLRPKKYCAVLLQLHTLAWFKYLHALFTMFLALFSMLKGTRNYGVVMLDLSAE